MRELAIARAVARDHRYLAGLVLLLGGFLVWMFARTSTFGIGAPAMAPGEIGVGAWPSAWAWGPVALVPCSLWAGFVAGAPPRPVLFALAPPVGRVRMFVARAVGVSLPMLAAAAMFAFVPMRLGTTDVALPPLAIAGASWLAFVAGALGGCAREDEPFALAIGVLLVAVQGTVLVTIFAVLGVGAYRPFEALRAASIPILAATVVVASWPIVDQWRVVLPRRGAFALRRAATRWLGSTAILAAMWTPIALWAGRPAQGNDYALIGVAPDHHAWVATGVRGDPLTGSPVDGLILVAPDGSRRDVAVWTGAGEIWGLGTRGEVQEVIASPSGEHVAVLLKEPPRVDFVGSHGVIASSPSLAPGGFGRGARWSADGRRFFFLRRGTEESTVGVLALSASGLQAASYDVSALAPPGILATCDAILTLGDPRKGNSVAFVEHDVATQRVHRVISIPTGENSRSRFGASPSGCRIAAAAVSQGTLVISIFDGREISVVPQGVFEVDPRGFAAVRTLVWLDESHMIVDVGNPGRSGLRLVVRDDGAVIARHAVADGGWGIDEAFGPPAGPWILESGLELLSVATDGTTLWRTRLHFFSAQAGPQGVVVDGGRVRWLGSEGQPMDLPAPWTVERGR